MRELLRENLRRSLQAMPEIDRLTAAWPVACGVAMASHGEIVGYEDGMVLLAVSGMGWLREMTAMRDRIGGELGRIAGVRVTGVHFQEKR